MATKPSTGVELQHLDVGGERHVRDVQRDSKLVVLDVEHASCDRKWHGSGQGNQRIDEQLPQEDRQRGRREAKHDDGRAGRT